MDNRMRHSLDLWAIKEEKYAARRAILPMLQAEEDERQVITSPYLLRYDHFDPVTVMHGFVKEWQKYLEEEARIMKDVPGWISLAVVCFTTTENWICLQQNV
ncbi:hypothetical protein Tco_1570405 [Tanacetum coccineum]